MNLAEGARSLALELRAKGHEAYFAGGCVRDALLGKAPKDWDVVTDATPKQVAKIFRHTVMVGAAFGVVRVRWHGHEYEVATYRTDGPYEDGRRPTEVHYSRSKEEDVKRRDFTINALLMDPESDEILDFVGGRKDLALGVIRAVGDPEKRFEEDRLRMLRAVRFAARFGFAIDPATLDAIRLHATAIRVVSPERIVAELHALWATARAGEGFAILRATGLAPPIFPFLPESALDEAEVRERRLVVAAAGLADGHRNAVAWASLLDLAPLDADVEDLLRGYKVSRDLIRDVLELLRLRPLLIAPAAAREADRMRVLSSPFAATARAFIEVLRGPADPAVAVWTASALDLEAHPLAPGPLLGGADLAALGLPPGPRFKELLSAVEDARLERRLSTREEALALVRSLLG